MSMGLAFREATLPWLRLSGPKVFVSRPNSAKRPDLSEAHLSSPARDATFGGGDLPASKFAIEEITRMRRNRRGCRS